MYSKERSISNQHCVCVAECVALIIILILVLLQAMEFNIASVTMGTHSTIANSYTVYAVHLANVKFGESEHNANWQTFSLANGIILVIH